MKDIKTFWVNIKPRPLLAQHFISEKQMYQMIVKALLISGCYSTSWTAAAFQFIKKDPQGTLKTIVATQLLAN